MQGRERISMNAAANSESFSSICSAYCPADAQRLYVEARERERAEAEGKPVPEWARPKLCLPRDGVYASPRPDFKGRCLNAVDTVIDFAKKSISSGADRCEIYSHGDAELRDPSWRSSATIPVPKKPRVAKDRRWRDVRAAGLRGPQVKKNRRQGGLPREDSQRRVGSRSPGIVLQRRSAAPISRAAESGQAILSHSHRHTQSNAIVGKSLVPPVSRRGREMKRTTSALTTFRRTGRSRPGT